MIVVCIWKHVHLLGIMKTSCYFTPPLGWLVDYERVYIWYKVAGAPIVMFINIYAGESTIRKTCNFDKPLNHILKVMDGCMQIFCLVKHQNTHKIRMLELHPSPFFTDSPHEA